MQTRSEARAQPFTRYDETGLQELLNAYDARMKRLNDQYLRMMGEHIAEIGTMIPSDVHRLQQIRRMNRNLRDIQRQIANAAGMSEKDVQRIFEQAAQEDVRMAQKILGVPDTLRVKDNVPLQRILRAQARETAGKMSNLSNTTVVNNAYKKAVDASVSAVQSGVEDYGSAIRRSIREAGQYGLRVREDGSKAVDYESGYSRRLDTAVRMNILDGIRHLNQSIMEEVGRQFGADGIEIDAHMLCAEDHLPYQGQQFSNEDFEEIQSSLPRPFGEWNCRHSWHPILLGISQPAYTEAQLQEMRDYSTEEVTIDGRTKTRYEWSQEMRRCETAVRQQKDIATLARYAGDDTLRRQCQGRILALNEHYRDLANGSGLKPEFQRTNVAGFRDVSTKKTSSNAGVPFDIQLAFNRTKGNNSFSRTVNRTNPHYDEGKEYQLNCTHCAIAYEMRRRGYDVTAAPAILDENGKISQSDVLAHGLGYVKAFEYAQTVYCVKTDDRQQICDLMLQWGNGARAIIHIDWSDHHSEYGHVFIAEQINGKTYFFDPQNGDSDCSGYFTRNQKGVTICTRIDSSKITSDVHLAVVPAEKVIKGGVINDN